ncbi:flagellar biosynthesis anti-sigma factor FlgM [compost metagenome]
MEINRHFKAGYAVQSEAPSPAKAERPAQPQAAPAAPTAGDALPLEQLQEALRALPEVDLDKVAALKLALQRGELSSDSAALAGSILDYHGGKSA